jgi:hypothetical protein
MVRLASEGLRSVGVERPPLIQERLLYPAPRSPFTGRGVFSGSAPARGSPLLSSSAALGHLFGAAFALPHPDALSPLPAALPVWSVVSAYTSTQYPTIWACPWACPLRRPWPYRVGALRGSGLRLLEEDMQHVRLNVVRVAGDGDALTLEAP